MSALNQATKSKKCISKRFCNFEYREGDIIHHLCAVREGKIPFTKKWFHRIKPDEEELTLQKLPMYKKYYDILNEYREKYPENFQA